MPVIDIYNLEHEKTGELELDEQVFGAPIREHLFWEVVRAQLASRRRGTAKAKARAEVKCSTRKMFRQKGTGRARQGMRSSPLNPGGGVIFGPRPRNYAYRPPRKVRRAALRSALAKRLAEKRLIVVDAFALEEIKTKGLLQVLNRFEVSNALIVDERNERLQKSSQNLKSFKFLPVEGLNVYDILRHDNLILTARSVEVIEGTLRP